LQTEVKKVFVTGLLKFIVNIAFWVCL